MDRRISLIESIKLRLNQCLLVDDEGPSELPIYMFKCPKHGLVKSHPHGYHGRLECPFCLEERQKESEINKKEDPQSKIHT